MNKHVISEKTYRYILWFATNIWSWSCLVLSPGVSVTLDTAMDTNNIMDNFSYFYSFDHPDFLNLTQEIFFSEQNLTSLGSFQQ